MATMKSPTMQELLEAGVHFGHKVSRGHPKMGRYIFGARDGIHIIDLEQSEKMLKSAMDYLYDLGQSNKTLIVVATKKQARDIVLPLAKEAGAYYITERWVGGLLTNFDEVRRNFKKLLDLKKEQQAGTLSRYTKKEQLLISRRLQKFDLQFGGVADMTKLPDTMMVVDAVTEDVAIKEANKLRIPVVGFSDTNANPAVFEYPVPANDDGIKAIAIVAEALLKAYIEGKKAAAGIKAKAEADAAAAAAKAEEAKVTGALAEETQDLEEVVEKAALDEAKG